jgi:hypothetical protein
MEDLLKKLNYKGQKRIAILNGKNGFADNVIKFLSGVQVDIEIDPRYPYEFILVFVQKISEVEKLAPKALHNLVSDGILWFAYPKLTSKKFPSDISRDRGWKILTDSDFDKVRQISVDDDWTALRFRNSRFIKKNG